MSEDSRKLLKEFIDYNAGKIIREDLHQEAKINYVPRHSDRYLEFMNVHECSFKKNHPQEVNSPYFFTLFTVVSQHVRGDTIEECLDKAIDCLDIGDNEVKKSQRRLAKIL